MSFGQFASTTQFYLYGRSHCTRTGWEKASRSYDKPDLLESNDLDLSGKIYLITGANAGIGKEITTFLAKKKAKVFMVCRNRQRAEKARDDIIHACSLASPEEDETSIEDRLPLLIGDCGLETDVKRIWDEFVKSQSEIISPLGVRSVPKPRLDALICNAGALLNEKTLTNEGVEVTFATHLLFGTYLLGKLAFDSGILTGTEFSRFIVVSSGGMYNTKFPSWELATATDPTSAYDGQFAYAYAKRGQVLLCEKWAEQYPTVKVVSCHPGWTQSEGLDSAYGEQKKYLEPLRSGWQGAEGIIWLAIAPWTMIQSGGFYLDRSPQVKHMAGPFFSEGSYTKNTPEEVNEMLVNLERWSSIDTRLQNAEAERKAIIKKLPLTALTSIRLDIPRYMGRWYVLGNIPTSIEIGAMNCIENYKLDDKDSDIVRINFEYQPKDSHKGTSMGMRGKIHNQPINTHWLIDPKVCGFHVPLSMDYLLIDIDEDYSYCCVSTPDRSFVWIMTREVPSVYTLPNVPLHEVYRLNIDRVEDAFPLNAAVSGGDSGIVSEKFLKERKLLKEVILPKLDDCGIDVSKILRCAWMRPSGENC